jgi:hypothetical protein
MARRETRGAVTVECSAVRYACGECLGGSFEVFQRVAGERACCVCVEARSRVQGSGQWRDTEGKLLGVGPELRLTFPHSPRAIWIGLAASRRKV